jgi:chromosome segregation ATPase
MKSSPMVAGTIVLAFLAHAGSTRAAAQQAGAPAEMPGAQNELGTVVSQLSLEIRAVRLELHSLQLDYSGRILAGLEQETVWLQTQRRKLESREARVRDGIVRLEERLREPALSEAERRELLEIQKSLNQGPNNELSGIFSEKDALARREGEVSRQIQTERQKWEQAGLAAEGLRNQLTGTPRPAPAAAK